jgi:DNA polymerase I
MEVYYQLVKDESSLLQTSRLFSSDEYIGLDTETTDLDPYKGKLRLIQLSNGRETRIIDLNYFDENAVFNDLRSNEKLAPLRDLISASKPVKVVHNAKFDAKWIYHCLGAETGSVFDTYLASQLLWFGDQDRRHGLAEVALQFLNISIDKTQQTSAWDAPELTDAQLKYAARDAIVVWQLYEKVKKSLEEKNLMKVAQIEFDCVMPIVAMELNGFYLDSLVWRNRLEELEKRRQDFLKELKVEQTQTSFFETFTRHANLDSPEGISTFLIENGVPVSSDAEIGLPELQLLAGDYPIAGKVFEYLRMSDTISDLGEEFLKAIKEVTNRIHPDFRQITNPFARIGCRGLKLHKLAFDKHYDYRLSVPNGKSLIILDYPLIETIIMAYLSGEEKLVEALKFDFYEGIASEIFGNSDEELMLVAKLLHQAVSYGVGASYFAKINGISRQEAEDLMGLYFQTFPRLHSWLRKISEIAEVKREARSAFGRIYQFRFDERVDPQKLMAIRLAKVFAVQATLSDILKITLTNLYYGLKKSSAKLVNFIRDQIWIECDQADEKEISTKAQEIMQNILKNKLVGVTTNSLIRTRTFRRPAEILKQIPD